MNKYSYIIPFYNVKPYTAACLESILAQTYQNWECICVDDGSPDGLGEILDQYAAKDSRFKVIHQPNSGVGAARNAALSVMTGDWFLFVDGDDLSAPCTCEMCEKVLEQYPKVDMLMFHEVSFPQEGVCSWGKGLDGMRMNFREVACIVDSWMYGTGFCTRAYRRSVYGSLRFPQLVRGQDRYYLLDCMFKTNSIVQIDRAISGVRLRIGSTMRSPMTAKKIAAHTVALQHFVETIDEHNNYKISPDLLRSQLNKFMEVLMCELQQVKDANERKDEYKRWLDSVLKISSSKQIRGFQSARAKIISFLPYYFITYLLCCLPNRIKSLGFHR